MVGKFCIHEMISGELKVLENIKGRQRGTKTNVYAGQTIHSKTLKIINIFRLIYIIYVLRIPLSVI